MKGLGMAVFFSGVESWSQKEGDLLMIQQKHALVVAHVFGMEDGYVASTPFE